MPRAFSKKDDEAFAKKAKAAREFEPKCGNCRYHFGFNCQRNPPIVVMQKVASSEFLQPITRFPQTTEDDYCGEFKPRR